MKRSFLFLILFLLIHMGGLAQTPHNGVSGGFCLPGIPASLTAPELRADYLAEHYWDVFDFSDPALLAATGEVEPAFADFLTVLQVVRPEVRVQAIASLLANARGGAEEMFSYFADMFEKYLWDTASPLRSDELYILVLQSIVSAPDITAEEKIRPRAQLDLAQRNRTGTVAEDFTITLSDGLLLRLTEVKNDYVVLFFNSPDCPECLSAKSLLATSTVIRNTPGLSVVAVYPRGEESVWRGGRYPAGWINGRDADQSIDRNGLYDLRELPVIYLLDRDRHVLLKNATVREIEKYLSK